MAEKIKAVDPHIIVTEVSSKAGSKVPYFQIRYYDLADKKWHLGYGSRKYSNVAGWLKEYFEEVKADVRPERHGEWIVEAPNAIGFFPVKCINCGIKIATTGDPCDWVNAPDHLYCGACGAKMDGKDNK